ncbi:MAG: leucine-rich repeat domain-containing protein [Pseudomonadales bacterium]
MYSISRIKLTIALFITSFLIACADYPMSFNNRNVFEEDPLFTNYEIADVALAACVKQSIADQKASRSNGLLHLNCSEAGIMSLAGIETFYALEHLNVSSNEISKLDEINSLGRLETLDISNNSITSVVRLSDLNHLSKVDLSGNAALDCASTKVLSEIVGSGLSLPDHCKN